MSKAGEAWRPFLTREKLSWGNPEVSDRSYFSRFAKGESVARMLALTDFKSVRGIRILEAGCCTALYSYSLATLGGRIWAFDYSSEALAFARELGQRATSECPNIEVHLFQGNILAIPIEDHSFDLVFNQGVIEYFRDSKERRSALEEMQRVTRPGGWVAVIVQNLHHPLHKWWEATGYPGYTDGPPMHSYSADTLAEELREIGLWHVASDGIYPWQTFFLWPRPWQNSRLFNRVVDYLRRNLTAYVPLPEFIRRVLGPQIVVTGQKCQTTLRNKLV